MRNLDRIFKSREVTLSTKVHIVKAMYFSVIMYQRECWILKKINPEYSLEGLMLKLQYFGYLIGRIDSLKKTLMLGKIEGSR